MEQLLSYVAAALDVLVQLAIIAILGGIFMTLIIAVRSMASNRAARWDLIAYIAVMLLVALVLFTYYPEQAIRAVRSGAERARPEAEMLREELRQWQPEWAGASLESLALTPTGAAAVDVERVEPPATATPWPAADAPPATAPSAPIPTATPWPTPTPCVIGLGNGQVIACPPTPEVQR